MKRRAKRKKRPSFRIVAAVCLVLAAAAVAYAVTRGPSWASLSEHARTALAQVQAAGGRAVAGALPADGGIEVWFAPATPANPQGIDDRLVSFLQGAQRSIRAAFYDLELQAVADALIERKRAGIAVALVSDSHYEDREAVQSCIRAGIQVVFDKRGPFMHNKFCIVDGQWVWTGSTNATYNCMYRNNNNSVVIGSSALAGNYAAEFSEMFDDKRFGGRSPRNTAQPVVTVGSISIENYFAPEDEPEAQIVSEIGQARRTIDFMAFSFTSEPIAQAVAERLTQRVRVRGLFEARNAGARYCRDDFLASHGAEIHVDTNPYSMHHKVFILDGETVITGSYNFSKNAAEKNDENVIIIHDARIAQSYTLEFEALIQQAR